MPEAPKPRWTPVRRGLVDDPTGKHYRRLKNALWLLVHLFGRADWDTGMLYCKVSSISRATGISRTTIRRWFRRLREGGYISTKNTGRSIVVQIHKWYSVRASAKPGHQSVQIRPLRGSKNGASGESHDGEKALNRAENASVARGPINSSFTKVLLRDTGGPQKTLSVPSERDGRFPPPTREELLASDLATGLEDGGNVSRYLSLARKHPEAVLRRLLSEARAVPEREIKRSRAALFFHLLKRHAVEHAEDPRA